MMGGREAKRPAGLAFVAGVLDVVVGGIDLGRALEGVAAALELRAETTRVHLPGVEPRMALDDPLGHEPAHAARAGDAVGAEPGRHPEAVHFGGTEDELAVGRESLGPVDQLDDLGFSKVRHAFHGRLEKGCEPLPVRREQSVVEVGRDRL